MVETLMHSPKPGPDPVVVPVTREDPTIQSIIREFETFVSITISISIFGAATFAVIVGQMTDPRDVGPSAFELETVRKILGAAWLCFILTLAVAGYSMTILTLLKKRANGGKAWGTRWEPVGILASVLMHSGLSSISLGSRLS
ncbi:hypothetical protein MKZ38_001502 [Zalerion maritima]|uniref:Uncharacterized protein n=1 Tax=Zalerion maritima TaxID=339359 RepID=A0AAD5WRW4_9PEZI|nr:hypothetical protein MKZ38_001502 [Zalerion maritima]